MTKEIKHDFTNPQFDGQKGIPQGVDNTGPVQNPNVKQGIQPNFGNPGAPPGNSEPPQGHTQGVKGSRHTEEAPKGG